MQLKEGFDPVQKKRQEKTELKENVANTFKILL